jgi:hypothetical protein
MPDLRAPSPWITVAEHFDQGWVAKVRAARSIGAGRRSSSGPTVESAQRTDSAMVGSEHHASSVTSTSAIGERLELDRPEPRYRVLCGYLDGLVHIYAVKEVEP